MWWKGGKFDQTVNYDIKNMFGLMLIHCRKMIVDVFVLGDPRERFLKCREEFFDAAFVHVRSLV